MNYQNGKIYCIRSNATDNIYIGSTCQQLFKRLYDHRKNYKSYLDKKYRYTSSYDIVKFDDSYIELIELYPCNSKIELLKREGEIIRQTNNCVNKNIAGREGKQYYNDNIDKLKQIKKQYNLDNKDKISEYKKQYNLDNKNKISDKNKQKIKCDICNIEINKAHIRRHERSIKHITKMIELHAKNDQ